ncbi:glycosyltransferase [Pseudoxanthomonas sp. SGT-18]|uniref:glycosyltransferase n=1 Tax=Pseudoxanthomonas sp. SGT-18 TaxID=2493087 RepID=UPI000F62A2A4|nr:glycosyltransferase [Pseudoxanthomonas sp. SGT-18]
MYQSRLHRRLRFPYYLMAPDYQEASSRVQCVHYLCHALNLEGADAYLVGAKVLNPALKTPVLTDEMIARHVAEGRPGIAIYPEIVQGSPIPAAVAVRYMLNREGVIGGKPMDPGPDDLYIYHRREFMDPERPGQLLTVPMVDPERFSPQPEVERTLDLLYLNRVPASEVDFSRLPPGIVVLSPENRLGLDELADVLRQARVLYTYESSTTCRLAIMCGCPVVPLVAPGYENLAVTPRTVADLGGGGFAWDDSQESLELARSQCGRIRELVVKIEDRFWKQLHKFIETTQEAVRARQPVAAAPGGLRGWLEARTPLPAQAQIIAGALAQEANPVIGVLVNGSDPLRLGRTLRSLAQARELYPHLKTWCVAADGTALPADAAQGIEALPAGASAGAAGAANAIAAAGACDWLMVVDAGCEFVAPAMQLMAVNLVANPELRAVYADAVQRDPGGGLSALFRPDFNLDLLLSAPGSHARHWLYNCKVLLEAGGLAPEHGQAAELDLLLRLVESGGFAGLGHVHEPLLVTPLQVLRSLPEEERAILRHLRDRGYEGASVASHLPGLYRVGYGHPDQPLVSVLVPTRDQFALVQRCLDTLLEKTRYPNYEVLVVDNGSTEEAACRWLDGIEAMGSERLRVLRHPGPFDYPALVNAAAAQARGEYLLLLDNDTAIVDGDWLDTMLNHAQRPEVGVVGPKLIKPDGSVEAAGLVLGAGIGAAPAFEGHKPQDAGYMYRLQVDQDYSAVPGSCLMVRTAVFHEVGGLRGGDLRHAHSDVDFCLRVGQAGYLVVWTPHALVLHEGGASRARVDTAPLEDKAQRAKASLEELYRQWLPRLARDPAHNLNLSLGERPFQVETASWLNHDPLPWRPLPVVLALPADRHGCGYYRVIHPARAMSAHGVADARVGDRYLSPVELERMAPQAVVFQRQMLPEQAESQRRMTGFSDVFKVAELDDYLPNVPLKSAHRNQLPQDVLKSMRAALKQVDRLVVSTEPLAEALRDLHPDIRVSRNRLPAEWWGGLRGGRRQGKRPRVGWAGGIGHRGDLEMVADVVEALAGEVEWVFMGMCPERLRPYVHEYHPGVAIEQYPARLAALDLDLAIAPLEDNQFNRCKSNLRLLEFGACGFPVVCSDVEPFRDGLPVTRVKRRFRDWMEAIRMHLSDLDAAARAGEALREAVHRDWMLDEASAGAWLATWLPD